MQRFWRWLGVGGSAPEHDGGLKVGVSSGDRPAAGRVSPAPERAPVPAPPVEPPPEVHLDEVAVAVPIRAGLRAAVTGEGHAMMLDPEEFDCAVCVLGHGAIDLAGTCSLEEGEAARGRLLELDGKLLRDGDRVFRVQVLNALTDLGQRTIVQLVPPDCDAEAAAERRKGSVRLINRARPGTSLTRHNREVLLRTLELAGPRDGPTFLERLVKEGVVEGGTLEQAVATPVLPRKAVGLVLADYLGLIFEDVEENLPPRELAHLFTREQALEWEAIPCGREGDAVVVAMANPLDAPVVRRIEETLGHELRVRVAAATDVRVAVDKLFRTR